MTATQIIYQDATLSKGFSKICLLNSALGMHSFMKNFLIFMFNLLVSIKKSEEKRRIASHLEALDFDVSLVATEWFLCLFSKSLPSEVRQILITYHLVFISIACTKYTELAGGCTVTEKSVLCLHQFSDNSASVGCPILRRSKGSISCSVGYL